MSAHSPNFLIVAATAALSFWQTNSANADLPVYTTGHADIGVDYIATPPHFALHIRFGSDVTSEDGTPIALQTLAPGAVDTRVPAPSILREETEDVDLTTPEWDFLGVEEGEPFWFLPQTSDRDKPFFGFATDGLSTPQWSGPIYWSLESIVSAPVGGQISLWQNTLFGTPVVKFASYDGIGEDDDFTQIVGGHDHYNWGFSKPGIYEVEIGATGMRVGADTVVGSGIFRFLVGDDAGAQLEGDYNLDGQVDAADYVVWRKTYGQNTGDPAADGDGSGEVDDGDYTVWRQNFSRSLPEDNGSGAIPEPSAALLLLLACGIRSVSSRRYR